MRVCSHLLVTLFVAACATPESEQYPVRDIYGRSVAADPNSCFASVAARRYIYKMREELLAVWQPPQAPLGDWYFDLYLRIGASGEVKQVYAAEPENPLNESAVAAVHRSAPFAAVPSEAICITEEQFRARFGVQVR